MSVFRHRDVSTRNLPPTREAHCIVRIILHLQGNHLRKRLAINSGRERPKQHVIRIEWSADDAELALLERSVGKVMRGLDNRVVEYAVVLGIRPEEVHVEGEKTLAARPRVCGGPAMREDRRQEWFDIVAQKACRAVREHGSPILWHGCS